MKPFKTNTSETTDPKKSPLSRGALMLVGGLLTAGVAGGLAQSATGGESADSHSPDNVPVNTHVSNPPQHIEKGTVLIAKPTPKPEKTEPAAPRTAEPVSPVASPTHAVQSHHEAPAHHSEHHDTTPPEGTIIVDDSGMKPTDAPSTAPPDGTIIVDDNGMAPGQ